MKCKCQAVPSDNPRKLIYEDLTAELGTDKDFKNEKWSSTGHRRGPTPLTDLKHFDIVIRIPIGEEMHLVYKGNILKLLLGWDRGTLAPFKKWSKEDRQEISAELMNIKLPSEFPVVREVCKRVQLGQF